MKKKVQNTKINNLQARPKGSKVININESKKLILMKRQRKTTHLCLAQSL